jgi:hypothetical protein
MLCVEGFPGPASIKHLTKIVPLFDSALVVLLPLMPNCAEHIGGLAVAPRSGSSDAVAYTVYVYEIPRNMLRCFRHHGGDRLDGSEMFRTNGVLWCHKWKA